MRKFSGGNFFYSSRPRIADEENTPSDTPLTDELYEQTQPIPYPQKLSQKASSYLRMSREHDRIINEMLAKKHR